MYVYGLSTILGIIVITGYGMWPQFVGSFGHSGLPRLCGGPSVHRRARPRLRFLGAEQWQLPLVRQELIAISLKGAES